MHRINLIPEQIQSRNLLKHHDIAKAMKFLVMPRSAEQLHTLREISELGRRLRSECPTLFGENTVWTREGRVPIVVGNSEGLMTVKGDIRVPEKQRGPCGLLSCKGATSTCMAVLDARTVVW
jgi:hypothetical protein